MGDDEVRRVAILGGGMGALAAAFELSATPELRARYRITVYQMGFRLGGRCASARNPKFDHRSEEHALHIWFGFYRNAFGLLRRTYEGLARPESHPFRSVDGVFLPRHLASFGTLADDGGPWDLIFPTLSGHPWGQDERSPAEIVARLVEWVVDTASEWSALGAALPIAERMATVLCPPPLARRLRSAAARLARRIDDTTTNTLRGAVAQLQHATRAAFVASARLHPRLRQLWVAMDLALAMLSGLLDPADRVLLDGDLGRIDDREFRDWLVTHGAWEVNVWAPPVRAFYDATFAYRDGDPRRPAFAAGVATRLILRILLDYPGSVLYLPVAGFGETVVQPLYELLSQRGVRFEFFHHVDRVEGDPGLTRVERIQMTRQAKTIGGAEYEPLIEVEVPRVNGTVERFRAWPPTPRWEQLENGVAMEVAGVDFESRWYDRQSFPGEPMTLCRGTHFDDVIFGIPLHAAREVLAPFASHPVIGRALAEITAVPTVSAQVWLDAPTSALGWKKPPAVVGAPLPHDIWSDMTHVMDHEPWPRTHRPRSLHYLCAVAPLEGVWAPPSDHAVPARARAVAKADLRTFLVDASWAVWPGLGARGTPFDWNLLHDEAGSSGEARLEAQYVRANVDPTECCPTSLPGSVAARPAAGASGVDHLLLASDSLRTGIDTSCVESAVMAGRQAARALAGSSFRVPGEDFLARLPSVDTRKPRYVAWRGLGEMSIPSPVVFEGCTAWVHPMTASRKALQALVDEKLNHPAGGALRFHVPFGAVMLTFLYGKKGFSRAQAIGHVEDREMSFVVLVTYAGGDGRRHPALWMPYLAVDTSIAMAAGRETWGFPKERGEVLPPSGGRLDASAAALHFPKLDNATQGKFGPIVTVVDRRARGSSATRVGSGSGFIARLVQFLQGVPDVERLPEGDAISAETLVRVPIVNLKQFRDAEDDTRACYQAIELTWFELSNVGGLQVVREGARCDFAAAESHDFVRLLGLPGHTVSPPVTLVASFDFVAGGGRTLWRA